MKNSVIVIYCPIDLGATKSVSEANHKLIRKDLDSMRQRDISHNFDCIVIEDPARIKVEVEVFFNPYQE